MGADDVELGLDDAGEEGDVQQLAQRAGGRVEEAEEAGPRDGGAVVG